MQCNSFPSTSRNIFNCVENELKDNVDTISTFVNGGEKDGADIQLAENTTARSQHNNWISSEILSLTTSDSSILHSTRYSKKDDNNQPIHFLDSSQSSDTSQSFHDTGADVVTTPLSPDTNYSAKLFCFNDKTKTSTFLPHLIRDLFAVKETVHLTKSFDFSSLQEIKLATANISIPHFLSTKYSFDAIDCSQTLNPTLTTSMLNFEEYKKNLNMSSEFAPTLSQPFSSSHFQLNPSLASSSTIDASMIVNTFGVNLDKKYSTNNLLQPSTSKSLGSSFQEFSPKKPAKQQKIHSRSSILNSVNFECDNDQKDQNTTVINQYANRSNAAHRGGSNNLSLGYNAKTNCRLQSYSLPKNECVWGYEPKHSSQHQPFDLEDALLLKHPILPPNSHFFCCFYKFHITAVAKVLSVMYAFFNGGLCLLSYKSQHAAAFLIAVLVTVSVCGCTLYATFKWSKLCLIPFFLLQAMLIFYSLICIAILLYAIIIGPHSFTFAEFHVFFDGFLNLNTKTWIFMIFMGLIILTLLFCYSALLFWYEYQFIAEVDRFLKTIRKSSSQASKDDPQNANGNTMAF